MSYQLKFRPAAAKDLYKLTKKDRNLGDFIINGQIPELLRNPHEGRVKRGDLSAIRSKDFYFQGVSYRILYSIDGDTVRIFAIGVHDMAYRKAKARKGS